MRRATRAARRPGLALLSAGALLLAAAPAGAEEPLVVLGEGTRLRQGPALSGDVVGLMERGRVVELLERGELGRVGESEAPWLRVRAGSQSGWVFGALLGEPARPLPKLDRGAWDLLLASRPEAGTGGFWALRVIGDRLELARWEEAEAPPTRAEFPGWSELSGAAELSVADGDDRLWLHGRVEGDRVGLLVSPRRLEAPLELALEVGETLRGELVLGDVDGDGRREALVLSTRQTEDGEQREYRVHSLGADGSAAPEAGTPQVRSALLPAPDPGLRSVSWDPAGGGLLVELGNDGSVAPAGRLELTLSDGRSSTVLSVESPALLPKEVRVLHVPLPGKLRPPLRVEGLLVPMGVEAQVRNNRLTAELKEAPR